MHKMQRETYGVLDSVAQTIQERVADMLRMPD